MRFEPIEWRGAKETAESIWKWAAATTHERIDVEAIRREVRVDGDAAVLRLTNRFDATESALEQLRVDGGAGAEALAGLDAGLRASLELAAENIRAVAEEQIDPDARTVELPQGQVVTLRRVPVGAAGLYAPGGHAAYPSSVLMCAIPARVAGAERIALASPPGANGAVNPLVLAAAELCGVDEIYAMGGAQAIFALGDGTETIDPVDVIAGPGNPWVREAKRTVSGKVGIDSLAGPSELMLIASRDVDPEWAALDLCAQAEHGADSPLVAVAVDQAALDAVRTAVEGVAAERPGVGDAPLALVHVPNLADAIDLANAFAPEHLELLCDDAAPLAKRVKTAGCVLAGPRAATAFGDYVAGSNHVLPTWGGGRFSGPLGPDTFIRTLATVEIPEGAATQLAPHVKALAEAEGFPVHGESAMIRARGTEDE